MPQIGWADDEPSQSQRRWADVKNWMVEAESERVRIDGGTDDAKERRLVCRVLAVSSDNMLYYLCGHREEAIHNDWRNEPFDIEVTLQNQRLTRYHKFNRKVVFADLPNGTKIPDPMASDVLFLFLPSWPMMNYPAPNKDSMGMILVPQAARTSRDYRSIAERQLVGGEWCGEIISSSGRDKIWISENKDLCLMRREWYDPKTGTLSGRIITKRIAQVQRGLWMPLEIECSTFLPAQRKGEIVQKSRIVTRILRWWLNKEVTPIFQSTLKQGSIEYLGPGEFRQLSDGGTEHLDEVAAFYRGPLKLPGPKSLVVDVSFRAVLVGMGTIGGIVMGLIRVWYRSVAFHQQTRRDCRMLDNA